MLERVASTTRPGDAASLALGYPMQVIISEKMEHTDLGHPPPVLDSVGWRIEARFQGSQRVNRVVAVINRLHDAARDWHALEYT